MAVCFVACMTFLSCNSKDSGVKNAATLGNVAPDFYLKDVSGKITQLSEYRNKVVLLEFWAMWCPPCKSTLPELIAIHEEY